VNKVRIDVFIITNEESGGLGCKRRQHDNGGFSSESHEEIFPPLSVQPSDPDSCNDDIVWMCDEYTRINDCDASVCDILKCHNVAGHYDELLVYISATK
jgi:hypothetical protein